MEFRLGELFCGPGGIALGAEQANIGDSKWSIQHQWATDYDFDTCQTYRANICSNVPDSVIHADIRELNYDVLRSLGDIDGLAFGFPCNDFSTVGQRKGLKGEFGPLYSYGVKALEEFKPKWFFAENVGGLKHANDKQALGLILSRFRQAGYRVKPHLYKFEEYGIPQARHRIIIVGTRSDLDVSFEVPSSAGFGRVSSRQALEVPPIPAWASGQEVTRQHPRVIERLKLISPGENAFNARRLHEPENEALRLNVKGATLSQIYKRLDPDKPAYTVTGSGGGGTHMYHWDDHRALTNRERARLQTFPDWYNFRGSRGSVRKQVGMAVPPAGAKVIFEAILRTFKGEDYASVTPNLKLDD